MELNNNVEEKNLSLKLFVVLSRAHRAIADRVEADIKTYKLNTTEFAVLELLFNKGEQPIQQIGKKVLLASGSITYVVDKLEKKGLIIRKACPKDRRVTYTQITEDGNKLMSEIFPKHEEAIEKIFAGLDGEEKKVMISMLKKLGYHAQEL